VMLELATLEVVQACKSARLNAVMSM